MNQSNPASKFDLMRSDEQQIEMAGRMFSCLVEVRFYLMRIREFTDNQQLKANCNNTEKFLYQFQLSELQNLKQWVKTNDER